jgi:hypothetical protein
MRLAPVLGGAAATLALGLAGPRLPGAWEWLGPSPWPGLLGLWVATQPGLFTYLLASAGRASRTPSLDALAASLIAATALPGIGAAALLVPLVLSPRRTRVAPLACAGLLAALLTGDAVLGTLAQLAMLGSAIPLLAASKPRAANDNAPRDWLAWWLRELPVAPA